MRNIISLCYSYYLAFFLFLLSSVQGIAQESLPLKFDPDLFQNETHFILASTYIKLPVLGSHMHKVAEKQQGGGDWVIGRIVPVDEKIAVGKGLSEDFDVVRSSNLQSQLLFGFMAFKLNQAQYINFYLNATDNDSEVAARSYPKLTTTATVAKNVLRNYKFRSEQEHADVKNESSEMDVQTESKAQRTPLANKTF